MSILYGNLSRSYPGRGLWFSCAMPTGSRTSFSHCRGVRRIHKYSRPEVRKSPLVSGRLYLCTWLIASRKKRENRHSVFSSMQEVGLEPTRYCYHRHLKPARLPIPPFLRLYFCELFCARLTILSDHHSKVKHEFHTSFTNLF